MAAPPRDLRRNLGACLGDGIAFSVMVGVGESYLAAFMLALGVSDSTAGLITAIPLFTGAVLQTASPAAVARLGSYRTWILGCAGLQALAFLPLAIGAARGGMRPEYAFLLAAIYWGAGLAAGPAWNGWIEKLIPRPLRPAFFARRGRWAHVAVLGGLVTGGLILESAPAAAKLDAFAILFALAALGRLLSVAFLAAHDDAPVGADERAAVPPLALFRRMADGADGRLIAYLLAVQVAVYTSGPFFAPYMLRHLELGYGRYMGVVAIAFLARVAMLPVLGRYAKRHGARRLLVLGGLGIVPVAGLWSLSTRYEYLLAVEVLAGTSWAAYELGSFLLFFEAVRREERISVLTTFNLANALALGLGSALGVLFFHVLGTGPEAYRTLFQVSSAARVLTLVLLFRIPDRPPRGTTLAVRTDAVRAEASIGRPIVASIDEAEGIDRGRRAR